jgi:hypothetical protein
MRGYIAAKTNNCSFFMIIFRVFLLTIAEFFLSRDRLWLLNLFTELARPLLLREPLGSYSIDKSTKIGIFFNPGIF